MGGLPKTYASSAGSTPFYTTYVQDDFSFYTTGLQGQPTDTVRLIPISIPKRLTIDSIGFIGFGALGNCRVGIYADNGGVPDGGILLAESVAVAVASLNQEVLLAANLALDPLLYWLAFQNDNAILQAYGTDAVAAQGGTLQGYSYAQAFGAFTNPCPITGVAGNVTRMFVHVISIP